MRNLSIRFAAIALAFAGCSDGGSGGGTDAGTDTGTDTDGDTDSDADTDTDADSDTDTDSGAEAPEVCDPPIGLADTSSPDCVITDCSSDAPLREALAAGGVITFDCGGEATIAVTGP